MRASSKHPRVESSTGAIAQPPSSGDPIAEEFVDPTAAVDPPPSALDDSSIRSMLVTVMTVQVAHGQLLVDVLMELWALCANLASPLLAIRHKKGEYIWMEIGGDFEFLELWSFRLYLGASSCIYIYIYIFFSSRCIYLDVFIFM